MIQKPSAGKSPDTIVDPSPETPFSQIIRLCNFEVGSSTLQSTHKTELISQLTRHSFEGSGGHIDCVGFASKLAFADSTKSNQKLSEQRAFAVKTFIEEHGKKILHGFTVNVSMGLGDTGAAQTDASGNDGFFRSVDVKFVIDKGKFNPFPKPKPTPPPPAPVPVKPTNSFVFQAIQVSSASLGLKVSGAETDVMEFAIRDMINGRTRYYFYFGGAATVPTPDKLPSLLEKALSLPIGVSVGRQGDKKSFITRAPITDMAEWEGTATLVQGPGASLGSSSVGGKVIFRISPKSAPLLDSKSTIELSFTTAKGITTPSLGSGGKGVIVMMKPDYKPRKFPGEDLL